MTIPMIETLLYVFSGVLAGGSLAAYWTYTSGRKQLTLRAQTSEKLLKSAESRAHVLKDQLEIAQSDLLLFKDKLDRERHAKTVELGELRQSLQRGALMFAGYALSLGIMFGGTVSWICTGARAEARHLKRVMDIQVESRVALAQKQMLETELTQYRAENQDLRHRLQSEAEQKIVALAKLEALLSGMSQDKALKGFVSEQLKLIQELSRYSPEERLAPAAKSPAPLALTH